MKNKIVQYPKQEKTIEIRIPFCNDNYYAIRQREAERARRRQERKINTFRGIGTALMLIGGFCAAAEINDPAHWYMGCVIGAPLIFGGLSMILATEK